jgi:hypothetical protein
MPVRPKVETRPDRPQREVAPGHDDAGRSSRAGPVGAAALNGASHPEDQWSETLDLVVRATGTIADGQARIADLEARNRELETRFAEELRVLAARVATTEQALTRAEARRIAAEERAEQAEQRADTAITWLRRIHDHAAKHLQR